VRLDFRALIHVEIGGEGSFEGLVGSNPYDFFTLSLSHSPEVNTPKGWASPGFTGTSTRRNTTKTYAHCAHQFWGASTHS